MTLAERDSQGVEQLRRAVHALDLPDFAEPAEVLPLDQLRDATAAAWPTTSPASTPRCWLGCPR